ncbi:MAG: hypothetical protein IJH20_04340 [Bacilli bacterium]|nr:hypothetical protein [Bacilli bacterium]
MITFLSVFIDLIINNIIKRNSLFLPLFSLMSILFIEKKDKYKYLLKVSIIGIIYDIFYSNFYILNGIIFFLLGLITYYFYKKYKPSIIINTLYALFLIVSYQLLLFLIYNITKYRIINISELIFIIYHYLIINIIYVLIMSIIRKRT